MCVPLLCLVADMLRQPQENDLAADSYVHLQLDGLARNILQRRMRSIYSHLTSGIRVRQNCALSLCASIAARNKQLTWELYRNFDFTLPILTKLARPPRTGTGHRRIAGGRRRGAQIHWAGLDPLILSTREVYIEFVLAFFAARDNTLVCPVLARKVLLGNVLRFLACDSPHVITRVLRFMRKTVLASDSNVPSRLQAALFGGEVLEQLASISGLVIYQCDNAEAKNARKTDVMIASDLAHDILKRVCTDPSHGICPEVTSGGLDRKSKHDKQDVNEKMNEVFKQSNHDSRDDSIQTKRADYIVSLGKKCSALVQFFRKLKPLEKCRHAELIMIACNMLPQVAAAYLPYAAYPIDPRPSMPWFIGATMMGSIVSTASRGTTQQMIIKYADSMGNKEGFYALKTLLPASLNKAVLTKGLQHSSRFVRHVSIWLTLHLLRYISSHIDQLKEAMQALKEHELLASVGLVTRARQAAKSILPDPQVLLALHVRHNYGMFGDMGDDKMHSCLKTQKSNMEKESRDDEHDIEMRIAAIIGECSRIHTLNALAEYTKIVGMDGLLHAKIDPVSFLSISPLNRTSQELAATIQILFAVYGVRQLELYPVPVRNVSLEDSITLTPADFSNTSTQNNRELDGRIISVSHTHLSELLMVSARTPVASIRNDAARLAAVHMVSCGALDNSKVARREVDIWLKYLPNAPIAVAEATSSFLSEVIITAARRRSLCLDEGMKLIILNACRQSMWSKVVDHKEIHSTLDACMPHSRPMLPNLASQTFCEDVGISSLAVNALLINSKILRSSKRTHLQSLAIATYLSSVLFEILQQQDDPIALSALIANVLPRDTEIHHDGYPPSLVSLLKFVQMIIKRSRIGLQNNADPEQHGVHPSDKIKSVQNDNDQENDVDDMEARQLIGRISKVSQDGDDQSESIFKELASASGSVLSAAYLSCMSSSSERHRDLARAVLRAHGPIIHFDFWRQLHAPPSSIEFVAMLGSILHSAMHGYSLPVTSESTMSVASIGTLKDAFCSAIGRMEAEEVAHTSRLLKFWRLLVSAQSIDFLCSAYQKNQTNQARDHNRTKYWIGIFFEVLLEACNATLARAHDFAECNPGLLQICRQHLFGSSGMKHIFPAQKSMLCLQAVFGDLIVSELEKDRGIRDDTSLTNALLKFTDFFQHIVRNTLTGRVNGSMTFWMVSVLRHVPKEASLGVVACLQDFENHITKSFPLMRAFTVEVAAMILQQPTSVLRSNDQREAEVLCAALRVTFTVILSIGDLSNCEGTIARACWVAITALKYTSAESIRNLSHDFLINPAIIDLLRRAITSFDTNLVTLAIAIARVCLPHAIYLTSLINDLNRMECTLTTPTRISSLFSVVRAIIEGHANLFGDSINLSAIRGSLLTSDELKNMCSVFCPLAAQYLKHSDACVSGNLELSHRVNLTLTITTHAARILAGIYVINLADISTTNVIIEILLPAEGWLGSKIEVFNQGGISVGFVIDALAEFASAVRMMFHKQSITHPSTHHAYITCLTSTLRTLALIIPKNTRAKSSTLQPSTPLARAAATEHDLVIDLNNLLGPRYYLAARIRLDSIVSLQAFARATICQRFMCPMSLALLKHFLLALTQFTQKMLKSSSPKFKASLISLTRETFELAVSQFLSRKVKPYQTARLPAHIRSLRFPLQSVLEVIDDSFYSKALLRTQRCTEDGREPELEIRAEGLNFLLISLTCVSWNLHNYASVIDDRQIIHTTSRRVQSSMQSSASWKARQAGRIPLLAATHGATLSRCDMQIVELLVSLDIAAGGGILTKIGYLWGDAAAHLLREPELFCCPDLDVHRNMNGTRCGKKTRGWIDAVQPEMVTTALRHCEPLDGRRSALSVVHFAHSQPLFQAKSSGLLDNCYLYEDYAHGITLQIEKAAYNPAWVLPFALYALNNETMSHRDCVESGMLSLAFASTASMDPGLRCVAYAILKAVNSADMCRPSFREQKQITTLLASMQNAIAPSDFLRRMPIPTALLAAEAAVVSLHPGTEIFASLQHIVIRRASLGTSALPIAFLALLNGSSGKESAGSRNLSRTLRLWVLRLLFASFGGVLDETRLFRKSFTVETLMSQRFANLSTDPFARQLMLSVVVRATESSYAMKQLIDGSGIISWLGGIIVSVFHPICAVSAENTHSRIQTAGVAISALFSIVAAKGINRHGHTGAALDMLATLRDVRVVLEMIRVTISALDPTEIKITACHTVALPALRLYWHMAVQLSHRHPGLVNLSEVAALCSIVDAIINSIPKGVGLLVQQSLMLAMFDVIICSSEVGGDQVHIARLKHIRKLSLTSARSFLFLVAWAAKSASKIDTPVMQHCASIALHWASSFICGARNGLLSELVKPIDGRMHGVTKLSEDLILLRKAAGTRNRAFMTYKLMRAQTKLIRELTSQYQHDSSQIATEDESVCVVMCHPIYKTLLLENGPLDDMLAEFQQTAFRSRYVPFEADAQGCKKRGRGTKTNKLHGNGVSNNLITCEFSSEGDTLADNYRRTAAASFATTLLRSIFDAEPPSIFLRRATCLVDYYEKIANSNLRRCNWFTSVKLLASQRMDAVSVEV